MEDNQESAAADLPRPVTTEVRVSFQWSLSLPTKPLLLQTSKYSLSFSFYLFLFNLSLQQQKRSKRSWNTGREETIESVTRTITALGFTSLPPRRTCSSRPRREPPAPRFYNFILCRIPNIKNSVSPMQRHVLLVQLEKLNYQEQTLNKGMACISTCLMKSVRPKGTKNFFLQSKVNQVRKISFWHIT